MEASNSRVLALNILKEPGILASGIHVPELKSCPKCREEILSNPPQSITILSCNHVFHRACIEKDILYSTPGEARCPIFGCHRDIETIKVDLAPTRNEVSGTRPMLELAKSTQQSTDTVEDLDGNETGSDVPDIAEFLDKSTSENNNEPVSGTHNSELVTKTHCGAGHSMSNFPVPTWIKEKLNAKNNDDYEFMKALGLLEEPLETEQVQLENKTSANSGKVRATMEATSANEGQEQEHNTLNKEKSQLENLTGDQERTTTLTASVRDSTTEESASSLKRNSISETSTRLNADERSKPYKIPRNNSTSVSSDKKEKESHVLKGLIEELITDSSELFEDLPLDGNAEDFLYLYNKIVNAEAHSEIANQEVIRCYYSLGKVLSQRFKYHFEKSFNEHTAQVEVNKEFGDRLPSNITKSTIRKKAERARKIYMLFCDNRRTYSATSISKLGVDDIAYVISQIKIKIST